MGRRSAEIATAHVGKEEGGLNMTHAEKAVALFKEGCNCAQSVFVAFEDMHGLDRETALRLSSGFGAGMGKMRETCGALTGAFMAAGAMHGYDDLSNKQAKIDTYAMIRHIAEEFERQKGTVVCRELLGIEKGEDLPEPAVRTEEYYQTRPCAGLCELAANILDEYSLSLSFSKQ